MLGKIQDETGARTGFVPTNRMIWKGIEKVYPPRVGDFLWKALHGRLKCGPFFKHIKGWKPKQFCKCGELEDLDHIFECQENYAQSLWSKVASVWKRIIGDDLEKPDINMLIGSVLTKLRDN